MIYPIAVSMGNVEKRGSLTGWNQAEKDAGEGFAGARKEKRGNNVGDGSCLRHMLETLAYKGNGTCESNVGEGFYLRYGEAGKLRLRRRSDLRSKSSCQQKSSI